MQRGKRRLSSINTVISHHGGDSRKLTLAEMKRIYQETHHNSLYKKYNQPRSSNAEFPDIAYHWLIGTDGYEQVREYDTYSYHASNLKVNKESVAVCLTGNYDRDILDGTMDKYYREVMAKIRKDLPSVVKNEPHRKYASKSCPGKHITDEYLVEVFQSSGGEIDPKGTDEFDEEDAKQYTTKDIMDEVVLRDDFIETTITVIKENIEVLRTRN